MAAGGIMNVFPAIGGLNFQDFYTDIVLRGDPDMTITWMRQHGLLARHMDCPVCHVVINEAVYTRDIEDRIWRCLDRNCRKTVNIRKGSWFERAHLPLAQAISILFLWSTEQMEWQIEAQVGVTRPTVVQWLQYVHDVCSTDLLQNPRVIGGAGHTVAIDESLLAKRKIGNVQGRPIREQWVFGGVDLQSSSWSSFHNEMQRHSSPSSRGMSQLAP